jgi:hypothetical protein
MNCAWVVGVVKHVVVAVLTQLPFAGSTLLARYSQLYSLSWSVQVETL